MPNIPRQFYPRSRRGAVGGVSAAISRSMQPDYVMVDLSACSSHQSWSEFKLWFSVFFTFTSKTHRWCVFRSYQLFCWSVWFWKFVLCSRGCLEQLCWLMVITALQHRSVTVFSDVGSGDCGGGFIHCWSDVTDWLVNNVLVKANSHIKSTGFRMPAAWYFVIAAEIGHSWYQTCGEAESWL